MKHAGSGVVVATLIATARMTEAPALADVAPFVVDTGLLPVTADERSGWYVGASIGRGRLDVKHGCGACGSLGALEEGLSLSAHVGRLLNPRLGLLVEGWIVRYEERDNLRFADSSEHLISEGMLLGSAQVWPVHFLWVRAGVGAAWHQTDLDYPMSSGPVAASSKVPPMRTTQGDGVGAAASVALGVELARTSSFGFDIALRSGVAAHDDDIGVTATAITVGGSWY
jgi:hypothetical protein